MIPTESSWEGMRGRERRRREGMKGGEPGRHSGSVGGGGVIFDPIFFCQFFALSVLFIHISFRKNMFGNICREKLQNLGPKSHQKGHFTL